VVIAGSVWWIARNRPRTSLAAVANGSTSTYEAPAREVAPFVAERRGAPARSETVRQSGVSSAPPLHETPRLPSSFDELPQTEEVKQRLKRAEARGAQYLPMAKYSLAMYSRLSQCMRDRGLVPVAGQVEISLSYEVDQADPLKTTIDDAPVGRSLLSSHDTEIFTDCYKSVNIGQEMRLSQPINGKSFIDHEAIVFPIENDYVYNIFRDNGMWPYPVKRPVILPDAPNEN
jgi:hypothetical protein